MTNEALVSRLYDMVSEVTRLGGEEERTTIVPNILVADDSPSDLPSGYIKIVNPRDGTYVPCLVVAGLVVSTGDLVNVLFTKGTEPVALTQGSGSPGSNSLWKRVVTELSPFNDADSVAVYDDASTQRIEINPGTSSTEAFWEVRDQTGALKLRLSTDNSYRFLVSRGGLDVSQNIFRVDVTGTPQLEWDETNDVFTWNKGHTLSAGDLTIPDDLVHAGDTDTLLSFTDDQINIQAGGITMIRLDETVQDILYLGDVAGTGDVDVNLNNGQVTLTGSTGNVVITNGLSMGTVIGNLLMASVGSVIGGTGSSNPSIGASASANRVGNIYMASSTFINALNSYRLTVGPIGTDITMITLTDSGQDTLDLGDVAGTGDVDIDFSNGQMFLRGSDGFLGIGNTNPTEELDVNGEARVYKDGNAAFFVSQATTDAVGASFQFLKSRGTHASPTTTVSADLLGQEVWKGHDGTTFQTSALLRVLIDGAVSSGVVPSRIVYQTTDTGGSRADRVTIKGSGLVGIGTGSPSGQLHVDQASTTAAVPVLYLDQADISEEMIEFNTTIGVGNAIEAAGAKTLTTTHFIKVTLPGGLTRYWPVGTIA